MFAQQPHDRRRFFGMAALSLAGAWIGTRDSVTHFITAELFRLSSASDLASPGRATAWLNSAPLTPAELQGKVVLIDFWTYTCINWLRTVPYVRAWAARYKDQGLVVIGVHTPEFTFEEDVDNVRRAAKERDVTYPIAIDNRRAIWSGAGSAIATGRRCTLSMRQGACAVITSAKATTKNRKREFDNCWQSPEAAPSFVGQPPGADHGSDIDHQGQGTVTEQRLYQMIRQSGPIADRQFEIEFLDSGVEAFAFTFG